MTMRNAGRWFGLVASVLALVVASGVAGAHEEDFGIVSGAVSYQHRIALVDNAEVLVQLLDVSRMDVPATVIASQLILTNGRQVPLEYSLHYDLASLSASGTYAVSARVTVDGALSWISDTRYEVISNGASEADIILTQVSAPDSTAEATAESTATMSFGAVTGTILYLPRIALPDNAVIQIDLSDISVADAPAFVLASQQFVANGRQVPFSFVLNYDTASINDSGIYSISARILVDGELAWISDTVTPVISNGVFEAEVVLVQVS